MPHDNQSGALARYLADNPAMSARDFKGKGFDTFHPFDPSHAEPREAAWDKLDASAVRDRATGDKARFLPRNVRQAAGRDPSLVWDERSRSYRRRGPTSSGESQEG